MNKPNIILIGGGGHCKSCIDVIEKENKFKITGIIDVPEKLGQKILKYKVIGNDDDIPKLAKQKNNFLITIGHLGNSQLRNKLFKLIKNNGGTLPTIISPLAHVSIYSKIKEGTIIMHQVIVNADVVINENCIINNKALIEHDSIIENDVHISTGAVINGNCVIHENCLIGSSTVLKQSINITSNTIIGAGSVVVKDITESGVYVGIPAKKIK